MTLRELNRKIWEWKIASSSLPSHAVPRPRLSDKDANSLQKAVYEYSNYAREGLGHPINCAVIDVKGTYRPGIGYTFSGTTKGVSDLWLTIAGRSICLEVKIGKDRQSDHQKEFERRQKVAGGHYHLISSWDDFWKIIEAWI